MKVYPEVQYLESTSNAEVRIGHLLNAIESEETDFAYHSFALNQHEYKRMGEIDFVIGFQGSIIILEVKGGRIHRENGMWAFTNRVGETNYKSEGPWEQARSAMFAFKEKFDKLLTSNRINYTYMVATPDADLSADLEHESWQWLGPQDMTPLAIRKKLEVASKQARRKPRASSTFERTPYWAPDHASVANLRKLLTKTIDGKVPLDTYIVGLDHERLTLTQKQARTIQKLTVAPRVSISGGAGTGKTVIAAECARREASQGASVAFVCQSLGVRKKVSEVLQGTGVEVFDLHSLESAKTLFDVLIIDEGQDLINDRALSILDNALHRGFIDGRWLLFLDENNQILNADDFDRDIYNDYVLGNSLPWPLDENLRNTKSTVTFVHSHLAADIGDPTVQIHGPSSRIRVVKNKALDTINLELNEEIHRLVTNENISIDDIWIITCKDSTSESIVNRYLSDAGDSFISRSGMVRFTTAHEVKGLEIPVALIIDVEDLGPEAISKVYVGFTRASLYMCAYVSHAAKSAMETNLKSIYASNRGVN